MTLLSGPATAVVKNGSTYKGKFSRTNQGDLQILIESGEGEAILTFGPEEIETLIFPGAALISLAQEWVRDGNLAEAQPLLLALYRQRRSYLPFLADSDVLQFTALPEASLLGGQPEDAIAIAQNLLPYLTSETAAGETPGGRAPGLFSDGVEGGGEKPGRRLDCPARPIWRLRARLVDSGPD